VSLALLGIIAFVIISDALEQEIGLPVDTTYRVACAAICLLFIYQLGFDYPGERWPRVSLWIALMVNAGLFFTPLIDRPPSRGELVLFALPNAIVVLSARIAAYPVVDGRQRATRQLMILCLVLAVAFCALLFTLTLLERHSVDRCVARY